MIAIGRGVADKDSLGVAAIGRSDQILVSIKVDVGLSAVVRAFVGRSDSFCYRDIGELPITVIAVQLAGIVFSAEWFVIVEKQVEVTVVVVVNSPAAVQIP